MFALITETSDHDDALGLETVNNTVLEALLNEVQESHSLVC